MGSKGNISGDDNSSSSNNNRSSFSSGNYDRNSNINSSSSRSSNGKNRNKNNSNSNSTINECSILFPFLPPFVSRLVGPDLASFLGCNDQSSARTVARELHRTRV